MKVASAILACAIFDAGMFAGAMLVIVAFSSR